MTRILSQSNERNLRNIFADYAYRARPFRMLPLRLLYKLGLLKHFEITVRIRYADSTIKVPLRGGRGIPLLRIGLHEHWMLRVLERLRLDAPGIFVDVGVNLGQTLIKVKSCFPQISYVGFEPNPLCAAYVIDLIDANDYRFTYVFACALSDDVGSHTFLNRGALGTRGALSESAASSSGVFDRSTKVIAVPGDEVFRRFEAAPIKMLKIDVEGSELAVIRGCLELIACHRPYIIVEVLPPTSLHREGSRELEQAVRRADALATILRDLGYEWAHIVEDGKLSSMRRNRFLRTAFGHSNDYFCWGAWHEPLPSDMVQGDM